MSFELRLVLNRLSEKSKPTTKRESVFQPEFREDLRYWVETDRKTALRIFQLIEAIMRDVWSRRITQEHRLVYVVGHDRIDFVQARYHY